jgi:hypothetical protein
MLSLPKYRFQWSERLWLVLFWSQPHWWIHFSVYRMATLTRHLEYREKITLASEIC